MAWEPGPVVTRRRLGGELKRLRLGSGLLLEDVANKLECSPSKISRLENGKGIPFWRDVRDMLDAYAVPEASSASSCSTGRRPGGRGCGGRPTPTSCRTGWLHMWSWNGTPRRSALSSRKWCTVSCKRDDYARAVLSVFFSGHGEAEIDRMVDVRRRRRKALDPEHGLAFCCVLDESTLHRVVGSAAVLRDQVAWLLEMSKLPHVEVRIFPFSAGFVTAALSSCAVLDFSEGVVGGLRYREGVGVNEVDSDPSAVRADRVLLDEILAGGARP